MRLDTLNFTLIGIAALLLAIAGFRMWDFKPPRPSPPKNPIGF